MILKHVDRSLWGEVWLRLARCPVVNRRLVYRVEQYARIDEYRANCRYVDLDEAWAQSLPCYDEPYDDFPEDFIATLLSHLPSHRHRSLAVACLAHGGLQKQFCRHWDVKEPQVSHVMRETKALLRGLVERMFPEMMGRANDRSQVMREPRKPE